MRIELPIRKCFFLTECIYYKTGGKTMSKVTIMDHPLIQHKISLIRNKKTGTRDFRTIISEIAMLECYESTRDLKIEDVEVETPIQKTTGKKLAGKKLAIVPILRAGLGMVSGIESLIPSAKVGHIGMYRDPETLEPVEYYCKLPADIEKRDIFIVDPMLATGGSACDAINALKERGCKSIRFLCIIAAPEGLERLQREHPDVDIVVGALDEKLNDHGYIVPGLGDAGDRIFGTK
jgi:uracil phosphoribosyltransferase